MTPKKPLRAPSKIVEAVKFAVKAHKGQLRDGASPLPYVSHPIDVLCRLRYVANQTDEDLLSAAVLHDVLEECGPLSAEIKARFGGKVEAFVLELTRTEPPKSVAASLDEPALWRHRHNLLMAEIGKMSPQAQMIKLADRCSNLQAALATRSGEKLHRYLWQSRQILESISREVSPPLWEDIKRMLAGTRLPSGWKPPESPLPPRECAPKGSQTSRHSGADARRTSKRPRR